MSRAFERNARIRWRRGQWATVEAFLRGESVTRKVGPGMEMPEDGSEPPVDAAERAMGIGRSGQVAMAPRLDQLEAHRRSRR